MRPARDDIEPLGEVERLRRHRRVHVKYRETFRQSRLLQLRQHQRPDTATRVKRMHIHRAHLVFPALGEAGDAPVQFGHHD